VPLEDALRLVHLYAERRSPKYETAATRLAQALPDGRLARLQHFAEISADLAKRDLE